MNRKPEVVVFGGARVSPEAPLYEEARRLGRLLAQAGFIVATGGYQGTMEAISRGAHEGGGHVIGYTCDIFTDVAPNPWLSEERRTATLTERIGRMAQEGDAFIALHGGIGTLAELTVVWNLLLLDHLGPKPFLLLGGEWAPVLEAFRSHTQMGTSAFRLITPVADVEDAVKELKKRLHVRAHGTEEE